MTILSLKRKGNKKRSLNRRNFWNFISLFEDASGVFLSPFRYSETKTTKRKEKPDMSFEKNVSSLPILNILKQNGQYKMKKPKGISRRDHGFSLCFLKTKARPPT